jgi:hypothetical protein
MSRMRVGKASWSDESKLPDKVLLYGTEGIGKSTFGSDARDPIFLASEDGLRKLERRVKMFPMPTSFTEALEAIEAAITEDHDHKTFVIDTVDWLEVLLWSELCSRNNWKSIESPGYGKGYVAASEWWNKLFEALDRLRSTRGMEVVLLAHAHVKSFNPPHLDTSYDRFEIALHKNAASKVKQWVDYVLFMYYQERFDKEKGRVRAEGSHVIYTHRRPAFDAKWRGNVKDVIPGTYADFDAHRRASGIDINALRSESVELIEALEPDDELRAKIDKGLAAAGASEVKWAQCVERLRFLLTEKEENSDDGTSRAASGESGLVEAHQVQ